MLNLIKYVKRMKKLLFFVVLALFMCSCDRGTVDYGELYLCKEGTMEIVYNVHIGTDSIANGTTRYSKYVELPVGKYTVSLFGHNILSGILYVDNIDIKIRKDDVTTLNIPY